MEMPMSSLFVDWSANRGDIRIQLALLLFRTARRLRTGTTVPERVLGKAICLAYLVIVEWTWGIEIPWTTEIGSRLRIFHGTGIVVNGSAKLGDDVTLHQGVCIGARTNEGASPTIGHGVHLGSGSMILGAISVGDHGRIGAGAVVLTDVPAGKAAVGNPARII
jgi:putative colanic acid biosynthesis acetyltransferase WcaB